MSSRSNDAIWHVLKNSFIFTIFNRLSWNYCIVLTTYLPTCLGTFVGDLEKCFWRKMFPGKICSSTFCSRSSAWSEMRQNSKIRPPLFPGLNMLFRAQKIHDYFGNHFSFPSASFKQEKIDLEKLNRSGLQEVYVNLKSPAFYTMFTASFLWNIKNTW